MTLVDYIRNTFVIIGWVPAFFFPIWYASRMRWRATEMGRHVMGYSAVVAMAYTSGLIGVFLDEYPGEDTVRLTLNFFMVIVVWWRLIVFMRLRRLYHVSQREAKIDLEDEGKKI